jgi:DNA mismatch endonuclease (patch repair protein)
MLGDLLRTLFPRRKIIERPAELPGKPDYYLPGLNLAVFADGCFWHGCPRHGRTPEDNRDYWGPKIERNRARDRRATKELRLQGIRPVRVWDHELRPTPATAARKIRRAVKPVA